MKQQFLLFAPANHPKYTQRDVPVLLPVVLNGKEITKAIYHDCRYGFQVPEKLEPLIENGNAVMKLVFSHELFGESYAPRPDAKLVRIQIEENLAFNKPVFDDPNKLLEL